MLREGSTCKLLSIVLISALSRTELLLVSCSAFSNDVEGTRWEVHAPAMLRRACLPGPLVAFRRWRQSRDSVGAEQVARWGGVPRDTNTEQRLLIGRGVDNLPIHYFVCTLILFASNQRPATPQLWTLSYFAWIDSLLVDLSDWPKTSID